MRMKFLIELMTGILVILSGIYFCILPPQVMHITPLNESDIVALDSILVIKFFQPVRRQQLQHSIIPETHGEWRFGDPLVKNHLFRTLSFIPAIGFKPNTHYQIQLKEIASPSRIGLSSNFSFGFKTDKTQEVFSEEIPQEEIKEEVKIEKFVEPQKIIASAQLLKAVEPPKPKVTLLDIPLDWQDSPLSCEAASLKMALAFKGVVVSEDDIMEEIGYDLTPRKNNIWGDPYQIYVGKIDGRICKTGFGVYWGPVAKATNNWRSAESFSGWSIKDLIKEIELSNPVLTWGTMPVKTPTDCSWFTSEGKYIKAFLETHVRLVVGFIGAPEDPSKIILNDPLAGRIYWTTSYFLTNWAVFGNSGVVIK